MNTNKGVGPENVNSQLPLQVEDLGEQGLLQRLQRFSPSEIVGDDAAVIVMQPGRSPQAEAPALLVVTTDLLVDGVHFSDRTTSPQDVGWRAAAANLSDLAAMGAAPLGLTVGLAIPGELAVDWLEQVYQGLAECLQQYHTAIAGGDICRSPVTTLAITAFGQVLPQQVIRRCSAQPGDAVLVTGVHGASRAGLELLLNPAWGSDLDEAERRNLIQAHQRPQPRLDVLPQLWELDNPLRVAGMDSSDGLADAILQICRASHVGGRIERDLIPLPSALTRTTSISPDQALEWALYGGEDFELILCLDSQIAQKLVEQLGNGAAIVGQVVEGSEVQLIDKGQSTSLSLIQGFQHF